MKKSFYWIAIMLCLIMLAACSSNNSNDANQASNTNNTTNNANNPQDANANKPPEPPKRTEPVELVVYSNSGDSEESWNERFGNALKSKFPDYTIKYIQKGTGTQITEVIASGQRIDIYWDSIGGYIGTLLANDLQFDNSELIKEHNIDLTAMEPTVADSIREISDGKLYGVPVFNNNMIMYYNKDIFDKFGVDYPTDGMTWEEANALGAKVTRFEGSEKYAGLSSSKTHMLLMNQLSAPYIDPNTGQSAINTDPRWRKYFETVFVGPARAPGYIDYMQATTNVIPYRKEFLESKELAMMTWLSSILFVFPQEFSEMEWDMVSLPTFSDLPKIGSQPYPTYFGVTSVAKDKSEAMEVIKYLVSEEMQTKLSRMGLMPVLKNKDIQSVYGQDSIFQGKNFNASFYNDFAPISYKHEYDNQLTTPYAKGIDKVILTGDINTIFRELEEDANRRIAEANAKK